MALAIADFCSVKFCSGPGSAGDGQALAGQVKALAPTWGPALFPVIITHVQGEDGLISICFHRTTGDPRGIQSESHGDVIS